MTAIVCPGCGHENDEGMRFCVSCGSGLRATCPSCGESNPPSARFCGNCGAQLERPLRRGSRARREGAGSLVTGRVRVRTCRSTGVNRAPQTLAGRIGRGHRPCPGQLGARAEISERVRDHRGRLPNRTRAHRGRAARRGARGLEQVLDEARDLELKPVLTSRLVNVLAGTLHELFETERAREANHEAIEGGKRASFNATIISGQVDLIYADVRDGEIGSAEVAWPGLWEAAEASKGWHQWLWMTRLMTAKAQIDLAAGRTEAAVDEAHRAIDQASRYRRLKYICLSRLVLGEALLELGRSEEAVRETRRAHAESYRLGHPPTQWRASALVGRALAAVADGDGAEAASAQARQTLERFAAGLSPERRERFLAATPVQQVLTAP